MKKSLLPHLFTAIFIVFPTIVFAQQLPGTAKLDWEGDIVEKLIEAAEAFFLAETLETAGRQESFWQRDLSSVPAYEKSLEANRKELARILGVVDERVAFEAPEKIDNLNRSAVVFEADAYTVFAIRWPVFGDYVAEGLLVEPKSEKPSRIDIVIPDTAEDCEDFIATLCAAENKSVRTLIPVTVSRTLTEFSTPYPNSPRAILTNREYLYRQAFEMGRHLIGYEIQQVLALVDWLRKDVQTKNLPIHVRGYREGGMIAFYAGALDNRIDSVTVTGYFDNRNKMWEEPIDRNVFARLERFGDAQLAAMIFPRTLEIITPESGTVEEIPRGRGGAIGKLVPPTPQAANTEAALARSFVAPLAEQIGKNDWLETTVIPAVPVKDKEREEAALARERRMVNALSKHTQELLFRSPLTRKQFMSKLDTSSLEALEKSQKFYKDYLETEILGKFNRKLLPLNARTRPIEELDDIISYEVVLDVYPGMFAYGLLTIPKNLKPDEKLPAVVVQHGLDGRVEWLLENSQGPPVHGMAGIQTRLPRQGYITFAPQHLYVMYDRQRQIQRMAYPLKKTHYALMVSMNRQIVRFLETLPNVDMERLGYFGLSYGGKTALRIPPLIDEYRLVVVSADFGRWDIKMTSTFYPPSYIYTIEYEMFTFDLGNTFCHSDLASLIAPRPFFVERGNFDGVAWDEEVGYEFGKVFHLYQALLDIPDRLGIDWFKGPHEVRAVKSLEFLERFLKP